jgi:vacuolar protein sorting-associated protein 13A/C
VNVSVDKMLFDITQDAYNAALGILTHAAVYQNQIQVVADCSNGDAQSSIVMQSQAALEARSSQTLWRYATDAVLQKIKLGHKNWSWESYLLRKRQRGEYVNLWRRKLRGAEMSSAQIDRLATLEQEIAYSDIMIYRKLASASLHTLQSVPFLDKIGSKGRMGLAGGALVVLSLFLWIFLGTPITILLLAAAAGGAYMKKSEAMAWFNKAIVLEDLRDELLTWKTLYKVIAFDPEEMPKSKVPVDQVQFSADVSLNTVGVKLITPAAELLSLNLQNFTFDMRQRVSSLAVAAQLRGISISERPDVTPMLCPMGQADGIPVWRVQFEQNPLSRPGMDMFVALKSEPIAICVTMPVINGLAKFFTPMSNAKAVKEVARQSAVAALATARAQVKYAILNRKTIELDVALNAPRIQIPQKQSIWTDGEDSLFVNLGQLVVASKPERLSRADAKTSHLLMDRYLYDRYSIALNGVNAFIAQTPTWAPGSSMEVQAKKSQLVIRSFNVSLATDVCTIPAAELPSIKLFGTVSRIKLCVSRDKISSLLAITSNMTAISPSEVDTTTTPRKKKKKLTESKSGAPASARTSRALLTGPAKEAGRLQLQQSEALDRPVEIPRVELLHATFQLDSLCVVISGRELKREGSSKLRNIVALEMKHASLHMKQSNKDLVVRVEMQGLLCKDSRTSSRLKRRESRKSLQLESDSPVAPTPRQDTPGLFIIRSSEGTDLISLTYAMIPKISSTYEGVGNDVHLDVGGICFVLNRSALAYILLHVNDITSALATAPKGTPTPEVAEAPLETTSPQDVGELKDLLARVAVSIKELKVDLFKNDEVFSSFSLPSSRVGLTIRPDGAMQVEGRLGALTVTQSGASQWPTIVSVVGSDRAVAFHYQTFKPRDKTGVDMSVDVSMSSMEFVYLQRWVLEVSAYFAGLGTMLAARPAAQELAATQSASTTQTASPVANLSEEDRLLDPWAGKATRIRLNVLIAQPIVIVPRASTAEEHMRVVLGTIKLSNEISPRAQNLELVDAMLVDISGMNVQICTQRSQGPSVTLLRDTGVEVKIARLLWHAPDSVQTSPSIDIQVSLKPIVLDVDKRQLAAVFGMLGGNMKEIVPDDRELKRYTRDFLVPEVVALSPSPDVASGPTLVATEIIDAIRVHVRAAGFELNLDTYDDASAQSRTLLQLLFNNLETHYRQKTDGVMKVSVQLESIELTDMVVPSFTFRQVIAKPHTEKKSSKLFTVAYTLDAKLAETKIDVQWHNLTIVALPMTIVRFKKDFMDPMLEALPLMQQPQVVGAVESDKPAQPSNASQTPASAKMVVSLSLANPCIILVQDAGSRASDALVLDMGETHVQYENESGASVHTRIATTVKHFRFHKIVALESNLSGNSVPKRKVDILQPLSLRVIMKMEGGGASGLPSVSNMGVETDSIDVIVSYRDLQLFTKMNEAYQPAMQAFAAPAPPTGIEKSESKDDLLASDKDSDSEAAASAAAVTPAAPPSTFKLAASLKSLQFGMINDRFAGDYFVPLLRSSIHALVVSCTAGNGNTSAAIDTEGISAYSYNRSLAGWEPLIEPWQVAIGYLQSIKSGTTIHVTSIKDSVLNLNLTKTMVDSVFGILDILSPPAKPEHEARKHSHERLRSVRDLQHKKSMRNQDENANIHPYLLKNNTGLPMEYSLSSLNSGSPLILPPGESAPLAMTGVSRREIMTESFSHSLQVQLVLPDSTKSALCHVAISKVGISLHPVKTGSDTVLICDVFEQVDGSKEITFRGDYSITNNTDETILLLAAADDIAIKAASSSVSEPQKQTTPDTVELKPRARYSVDLARSPYKILRFKPKGSFEWSEAIDLAKVKEDEQIPIHCRSLKGNAIESQDQTWSRDWYSFAFCDVEHGLDHSVTIYSPLVVENMLPSPVDFQILHSKFQQGASHEMTLAETDTDHIHFIHALDDRVQLSLRVPGYEWSEPVSILGEFIKRDGSTQGDVMDVAGISKTYKLHLHDPNKRSLRINADVSRLNNRTGFRIVLYVRYWIANSTGLRLLFKSEASDKHLIAGQNFSEQETKPLGENQLSWYPSDVLLPPTDDPSPRQTQNQSPYLYYGGSTLSVGVEASNFSKAYKLGATNQGSIQIKDEKTGRRYVFFINVSPAPGRFWRSALVKILPCYIFANFTGRAVEWRQVNVPNAVQRLEVGYQIPLHWPSHKQPREVQVRYDGCPTWSNAFLPTVVGRFPIKMRNNPEKLAEDPGKSYEFISLHIRDNPGASTYIALESQPEKSFIQIKNRSNIPLVIRELGDHLDLSDIKTSDRLKKKFQSMVEETGASSSKSEKPPSPKILVAPHSTVPYSWTDPQTPDPEIMICAGAETASDDDFDKTVVPLTKIKEFRSIRLGPHSYLRLTMQVDGQSKSLVIRQSRHPRKEDEEAPTGSQAEEKPKEKIQMKFNLELKGIGVSIVDENPQEVMYLSMGDLMVKYILSDVQQSIECKLGTFQVDNDLYLTPCPVVLSSDPVQDHPFFHLALVRDPKYTDFFCYRYFAVAMQKLNVEADEAFLVFALAWSSNITNHLSKRFQFEVEERLLLGTDLRGGRPPAISQAELDSPDSFYFELFQINSMEIDLTYAPTRNFDVPAKLDSGAADLIVTVSPYLSPVEEAPIKLSGMLLRHAFAGRTEFMQNITSHYTRQFLSQTFKILGSAEWLGNPTSLVSGLGSGVYTFINEPANALVHSPEQLGISVAKGTKALIHGTIKGALNMAGKLVGNVGKLGALLTLDDDYKREREIMKHKKARHVGEGLGYGLKEFGTGLFKGITGVVTQPVKGAKEEGLKGFGKGLGKGLLGVVLKPTVGAVDLATRTVEGIKNTGSDVIIHKRVRLPRFFPEDHILIEYDPLKAEGQNLLKTLENGAFRKQYYVYHLHIKNAKNCILFSNSRVFLLEKNKILGDKLDLASPFDIEWAPRLRDLTFGVEADTTKLRVVLRPNGDPSSFAPDSKLDSPILTMKGSPLAHLSKKNKSEYIVPCASQDEVNLVAAKASGYIRGTDSSVTATKQIKSHRQKVVKELKKEQKKQGSPAIVMPGVNVVVAAGMQGGVQGMGVGGAVFSPRTQKQLSRTLSAPADTEESSDVSDSETSNASPSHPKGLSKTMSYTVGDAEERRRHLDPDSAKKDKDKKKKRHSVQLGTTITFEASKPGEDQSSHASPHRINSLSVVANPSSAESPASTPTKTHRKRRSSDVPADDTTSSTSSTQSPKKSPSTKDLSAASNSSVREAAVEVYKSGIFGSKWKKRFLVIAENELSIYEDVEKRKLKDRLPVASCRVKVEGDERTFTITSAQSSKFSVLIRVSADRAGWVSDLISGGAVAI